MSTRFAARLTPAVIAIARALAILIGALPAAFMADTLLHLLEAQGRPAVSARAMAITAVFNLTANLLLVPLLSYVGAAITLVTSEILGFALMFVAFSSSLRSVHLFTMARAPLIAGGFAAVAMVLLSRLSPGGPAGLALMATFAISAYLLALVALGAVGRQDAELVIEILPEPLRPMLSGERRRTP
jgi:O-antigen/teichoic acid export membrane protein